MHLRPTVAVGHDMDAVQRAVHCLKEQCMNNNPELALCFQPYTMHAHRHPDAEFHVAFLQPAKAISARSQSCDYDYESQL